MSHIVKNGAIDSWIAITIFDFATTLISLLLKNISYQFNNFCLINVIVILLFKVLVDFGSLIKIKGINESEVITITTSKPSKKPSTRPFS